MIDLEKVGKRIASLRRERGYTGEQLAERLHVSPQAVSKWENAKCLPETAVLPALAKALDCSIDSLLQPRELFILEAVYTDGQTHIPVTHFVNDMVRDNALNILVSELFIGASIEGSRLKLMTVKFQTPEGIYYTYALQNENLTLNRKSAENGRISEAKRKADRTDGRAFQIIGAYYGSGQEYSSVMDKMEHYEYFKWDKIPVNHETFPSNTASDDTEYLTLIYLNEKGIHTVSCPENYYLCYGNHHTELLPGDRTKCILKGIERLSWGRGMDCPWAGAIHAALRYMGENYTYQQLMGMSGACYRICFTDVWDYSCTDALVAFDYAAPLSRNLGRRFRIADRLEKQKRKAERLAIMEDIENGRPVLAINLRVAPEWGVITGYTGNGSRFLCRTYFDGEILDALAEEIDENTEERRLVFEENEGYLFSDLWPFLIIHFGEKTEKPSPPDILRSSLHTLVRSFRAGENRGYHQGEEAYAAWIKALSREEDFNSENGADIVSRRLGVNDAMLRDLIDSRTAAAAYLHENSALADEKERGCLEKIAENYRMISNGVSVFRDKANRLDGDTVAYNGIRAAGVSTPKLRREQICLLEKALLLERENCRLAEKLLL